MRDGALIQVTARTHQCGWRRHFAAEPLLKRVSTLNRRGRLDKLCPAQVQANTTYPDWREVAHWQSMCRSSRAVGQRHVESANASTTLQ